MPSGPEQEREQNGPLLAPRAPRSSPLFRSLRFRLTFWNAAALLLAVVATLFGLHTALTITLHRDFDRHLDEDAVEVKEIVERQSGDWDKVASIFERRARSHAQDGWFVQVLAPDGLVLLETSSVPEDLPPLDKRAARLSRGSVGGNRFVQRRFERPGLPPLVVRVGASLKNIKEDLARMGRLLLFAGGVLFLVAPLIGYWLAGRATRPLASMLRSAERLRPDQLSERLPLSGAGDELDRLAATVNGLLDRLAEHLGRQRQFVDNAAHELRSPLAALRMSLEVTLDRDRPAEEYRDLLADLVEECTGLGVLVNQLLCLAEGDAGELRPGTTRVRFDELVMRSVEMFRGVAEQKGVVLQTPPPPAVLLPGTSVHVRQVINNLLDNAIKFTPSGGTVTVEVRASPSTAQLRVEDTGCGIAAEDLPHVFAPFYRADKSRQRGPASGGTGLGLSICQAIVNAYGGRIDIDSPNGHGTRVTVELPLSGPP
jgi:heavy metal sensor kinase